MKVRRAQILKKTIRKNLLSLSNFLFCFSLIFQGCVPTKQLKKNEYLLYSQKIKGVDKIDEGELESILIQKPNKRIAYLPFMPFLFFYNIGKKTYDKKIDQYKREYQKIKQEYAKEDSILNNQFDKILENKSSYPSLQEFKKDSVKKIKEIRKFRKKGKDKVEKKKVKVEEGNFFMRVLGEPPSIYSEEKMKKSKQQMEAYLKNKGFFRGEVTTKTDTVEKRIYSTYIIKEGKPYIISSLRYQADSNLISLLQQPSYKSLIKVDKKYDVEILEKERDKANNYLKNNGFFDFSKQYIFFDVDSTKTPYSLDITTRITAPKEGKHIAYKVNKVLFETGVNIEHQHQGDTSIYKNIEFIEGGREYSKKVIAEKVLVEKGDTYSFKRTQDTQLGLAKTQMFKFININYEKTGEDELKAHIFTDDYEKYQYSLEAGLNITQSLPGPFVSLSLSNRNLFGACDLVELKGNYALEAQASATNLSRNFYGQEYGGSFAVTLPWFMLPLPFKLHQKIATVFPSTKIEAGVSAINRPEYQRTNFKGTISYNWETKKNTFYNVDLLSISMVRTGRLSPAFRDTLDALFEKGNTLKFSFDNSLVSNFAISRIRNNEIRNNDRKKIKFFKLLLESGGNYVNFLNKNFLNENEKIFGLRYFRYLKFNIDYRYVFSTGKESELALRSNFGIASAYGNGTTALPYEKYFFTGGSNSNRAWRPRRIGPGSYQPLNQEGELEYNNEQPGEILIESNVEWRSNLFSFFDWAVFIDASNIWTVREDLSRPGANFEFKDFWKELAIGGGVGLRLDFTFILIRFDLGIKLYDPARPIGDRFVAKHISFKKPYLLPNQAEINIGIGYPF